MDQDTALRLYEAMLLTRLTEERLVKLFRAVGERVDMGDPLAEIE